MKIQTDHPIAIDSNDHLFPLGAKDDYHYGHEFFKDLRLIAPNIKSVLDLGSGTGAFVEGGLQAGYDMYGVEGTDRIDGIKAWVDHKDKRLFHADIRYLFFIFYEDFYYRQGLRTTDMYAQFDLITAWDVMEHLSEITIDTTIGNICRHLTTGGWFMATIQFDSIGNERYHTLCKSREWWISKFKEFNFIDRGETPLTGMVRVVPKENQFWMEYNGS